MFDAVSMRLAGTSLSKTIGDNAWITPTVQTVHILAIAMIMAAVLMTNLRALGALGRQETLARFSHRYVGWIAGALVVLAASGSLLIIGEPQRSLGNPIFWLKMSCLAAVLLATAVIHAPLRRDGEFWDTGGRAVALRGLAFSSLLVWTAIIFSGRWIAYYSA
jgi:hypothetical protein